jgi:methylase of polypeptide subunit release factors
MAESTLKPEIINKLRFGADAAFAMLAGMQLDVFTPMKDGPMTTEQIASAIGVKPDRLRLLLWSLVAAGLLTEKDGCFSNTQETNQFLVKGLSTYMGNMHTNFSSAWTRKLKTAESIRTGVPQAKIDFSISPQAELEAFLRRINTSTLAATHSLLAREDFSSTITLADIGCGGAGLALTIAKACPHIQATAIDLPQIAPIAQKIVNEEGATDRVKVIGADVLSGPLPGSYDAAVLRALLQVLSPKDARLAVKNIAAAINRGGAIYIVGQILDDSHTSPLEAVGFNLNFINTFDAGESYTEHEHREWLSEAGFVDIERAKTPLAQGLGLMTARKPG